jgi:hypothetical protein
VTSVGAQHRELAPPAAVDGELASVTCGTGVLVVALPAAMHARAARLSLLEMGTIPAHGVYSGHIGHPLHTSEPNAGESAHGLERAHGRSYSGSAVRAAG